MPRIRVALPLLTLAALTFFEPLCAQQNDTQFTVNADTHALHLNVKGTGIPIVVFELEDEASREDWESVQSELAQYTTTVLYERKELDAIKASVEKEKWIQIVVDLHTTLQNMHLTPPYVVVYQPPRLGQSYIVSFIQLYPREVAGIASVDISRDKPKAVADVIRKKVDAVRKKLDGI